MIYIVSLFFIFLGSLTAQINYQAVTGATPYGLDTLAFENAQKISRENKGIMEKEVEPDKYIIGPGDEFAISVLISKPVDTKAKVAPDGNLVIPRIGIINLKGRLLSEAYDLIKARVARVFATSEIYVSLTEIREFKVTVSGEVQRPLTVSATAMDRVNEVIDRAGGINKNGSPRKIRIIRNSGTEILSADLMKYYLSGDKNSNPFVLGGDQIIVEPSNYAQSIEISGEVQDTSTYDYVKGDSLSTLIKFAQGFLPSSKLDSVEISRFSGTKEIERRYVDLTSWKNILTSSGRLEGDMELNPGDRVYVRRSEDWTRSAYVVIEGEVKYPGRYSIVPYQDKVSDILKRSGGFTELASVDATQLIRQAELKIEDTELIRLGRIDPSEMSESERRYFQSRIREKKGVMAINFNNIASGDGATADNIYLIHGDSIIVPLNKDFVNVQGRVNNPGYVKFNPNLTYLEYISLAGGFGSRADEDETFITKSKGEQFVAEDMNYTIEPGDVILVPPKKEVSFLEVFTEALTITTQLFTIAGVVIAIMRVQ